MVQLLHVFMFTPFLTLSSSVIIIRSLIAISSTNWIFIWAALELNLLRFIPILIASKNSQETEAAVKYFLAQALGSRVLLIRSLSIWFLISVPNQVMPIIILISLILKIGIAPCHMWYSSVITSINWIAALILSTWQKLAPLIIVAFIFYSLQSTLLIFLASINAIVGGIMGINQSHLRTIIAYSSITHIGWITRLVAISKPIYTIIYFIVYSAIISPIFIIIHIKNMTNRNLSNKLINNSPLYQLIIPLILLSLRGIPPLTGFIPKWMTISIIAESCTSMSLILILGAIINTYFYLNISFNILLRQNSSPVVFKSINHFIISRPTIVSLLSLFCLPIFILI